MTADRLWFVGAGRLGLALGLALDRAGAVESLAYSGRTARPPDHPLFDGFRPAARYLPGLASVPADATGVVIAVPDGAIREVVHRLGEVSLPTDVPVLHASGALSTEVLRPLAECGHPVGGVHVLAAVDHPVLGADRLRGAIFGVEGEGAALALAERIVRACGGRVLRVSAEGKPSYHAAAVFAANYAVALLGVAERLMEEAGVPAEEARAGLAALAAGAVENVAARGPVEALTGPVSRGDVETVALHLARLSPEERTLYCLLGRETLRLARARGLDPATADRLDALLRE